MSFPDQDLVESSPTIFTTNFDEQVDLDTTQISIVISGEDGDTVPVTIKDLQILACFEATGLSMNLIQDPVQPRVLFINH